MRNEVAENVANVGHWSRTAAIKTYLLYSFVDIVSSAYFRFRSVKHNYCNRQFLGQQALPRDLFGALPLFHFCLTCCARNDRKIAVDSTGKRE